MDESLLLKYLRNELDYEEVRRVESWVSEKPENRKMLEELYCTLFVADRVAVMDSIDTEASLKALKARIHSSTHSENKSQIKSHFIGKYASAIAAFVAGVVITIGIGLGMFVDKMDDYTVATNLGQQAQTILPDGSKVWLNTSTKLTYHNVWWSSKREVTLEGEAYFEVEKSKNSTFIVTSKGISTKVLGTKFNVRARDNENSVTTTLLQGKVSMISPASPEDGYLLKPGQAMRINTDNYSAELFEYNTPSEVLLWMKGVLDFKQHTLLQITHIMETLHNVTFVFEDASLENESFTGKFSIDQTPESILNVLKHTEKFTYRKEGSVIYLYRK